MAVGQLLQTASDPIVGELLRYVSKWYVPGGVASGRHRFHRRSGARGRKKDRIALFFLVKGPLCKNSGLICFFLLFKGLFVKVPAASMKCSIFVGCFAPVTVQKK
jgi:hypothetical protein